MGAEGGRVEDGVPLAMQVVQFDITTGLLRNCFTGGSWASVMFCQDSIALSVSILCILYLFHLYSNIFWKNTSLIQLMGMDIAK